MQKITRKHCPYTDQEIVEIIELANGFIDAVRKIKPKRSIINGAINELKRAVENSAIETIPDAEDHWERFDWAT